MEFDAEDEVNELKEINSLVTAVPKMEEGVDALNKSIAPLVHALTESDGQPNGSQFESIFESVAKSAQAIEDVANNFKTSVDALRKIQEKRRNRRSSSLKPCIIFDHYFQNK